MEHSLKLGCAAVLIALASPAEASIVTYTISGTVLGGQDNAGLFGGGNLTGKLFTADEKFDSGNAVSSYANPDGSGANGGSSTNGLSFVDVMLTIGGLSTSFSDYTSNVSSIGGSQFNAFVQSSAALSKNDIGFYIAGSDIKADYTEQNVVKDLADSYAGYYTLTDARGGRVIYANFQVTSLSAVSAVPLPSSALLFGAALLALGAAGYGTKRKRRPAQA